MTVYINREDGGNGGGFSLEQINKFPCAANSRWVFVKPQLGSA